MKYALAALCGMAFTLGIFIAGIAFSLTFLSVDNESGLAMQPSMEFPLEPVRVDRGETTGNAAMTVTDDPQPAATTADAEAAPGAEPAAMRGSSATAAEPSAGTDAALIAPAEAAAIETVPEEAPRLSAEHIAWCAEHYRSYRPEDNRYRPYGGGTRVCVSPFSAQEDDLTADRGADQDSEAARIEASAGAGANPANDVVPADYYDDYEPYDPPYAASHNGYQTDGSHIADCFARYRSYRPEDNTYQPYGGGPRQQCE